MENDEIDYRILFRVVIDVILESGLFVAKIFKILVINHRVLQIECYIFVCLFKFKKCGI